MDVDNLICDDMYTFLSAKAVPPILNTFILLPSLTAQLTVSSKYTTLSTDFHIVVYIC